MDIVLCIRIKIVNEYILVQKLKTFLHIYWNLYQINIHIQRGPRVTTKACLNYEADVTQIFDACHLW